MYIKKYSKIMCSYYQNIKNGIANAIDAQNLVARSTKTSFILTLWDHKKSVNADNMQVMTTKLSG